MVERPPRRLDLGRSSSLAREVHASRPVSRGLGRPASSSHKRRSPLPFHHPLQPRLMSTSPPPVLRKLGFGDRNTLTPLGNPLSDDHLRMMQELSNGAETTGPHTPSGSNNTQCEARYFSDQPHLNMPQLVDASVDQQILDLERVNDEAARRYNSVKMEVERDRLQWGGLLPDYLQTSMDEAVQMWRSAAAQDYAKAWYNLGVLYRDGHGVHQDDLTAAEYFRKAADLKFALARYSMGRACETGRGVAKSDFEAACWYRLAAEQGDERAQTNLGNMYREGRGVERDFAQAISFYRKAAEQGQVDGQNNLAMVYARGEGVRRNLTVAARWWRKAAAQGHTGAQASLANFYERGIGGVKKSELFLLAGKQGHCTTSQAAARLRESQAGQLDQSFFNQPFDLDDTSLEGMVSVSGSRIEPLFDRSRGLKRLNGLNGLLSAGRPRSQVGRPKSQGGPRDSRGPAVRGRGEPLASLVSPIRLKPPSDVRSTTMTPTSSMTPVPLSGHPVGSMTPVSLSAPPSPQIPFREAFAPQETSNTRAISGGRTRSLARE
mmetsp:Transcript_20901/g.47144  ORF Transcript_20901/g.47144 Transcript_20901/m.47144 type:complete len:548 (+) Transcript_20901:209-1852(+)